MKVLVDTTVVLDVFLDRRPFAADSTRIMSYVETTRIEGVLCATTVTTIDYLLGQTLPAKQARDILNRLLRLFDIAPVNRSVLEGALESRITDFEDAVLERAALLVSADAITTRNVKDFKWSRVTVYDPRELVSIIETLQP